MFSRSLFNDIGEMELALGIVPTFRSGPCDKVLEHFEGQPLPSHLRDIEKTSKVNDYWPPIYEYRFSSKNNLEIINLEPINAKEYEEEIGDFPMERGSNNGIYYF